MRHRDRRLHHSAARALPPVTRQPAGSLALLALLVGSASAQQLLPGQKYFLGGLGSGAGASADLNGDGRPDIAMANWLSSDLGVAFDDGAGGFDDPQLLLAGDEPVAIALADFDADGAIDIATANEATNDASVLLGTGDGTYGPPASLAVGQYPQDIVVADVNMDGRPDLVTADCLSSQVSVLLGDGSGGFAPAQPSSTDWYYPMRLDAGDLDVDGDVDLALVNYEPGTLFLLFGDGSGGFAAPSVITPYVDGTDVTIADANMDGFLDLLAPMPVSHSQVSLLTGNGSGGFDPALPIEVGATPSAAICADVDADGLLDLLTANRVTLFSASGSVSVLLATAPASYAPAVVLVAGGGSSFVAPLDMNEDGWMDLVTLNGGYDVIVYLAAGAGVFDGAVVVYPGLTGTEDFEPADLDSNGLPDLVSCGEFGNLSVLLADPAGGFQPPAYYPIGWLTQGLALGDLDGDTVVDAVTCDFAGVLSVLHGDSVGGFGPAVAYAVSSDLKAVQLGDMKLDGWLDIVTIDPAGNAWLLLNDTGGSFLPATAHAIGKPAFAMVVADVNADSGLDIVAEKTATMTTQASSITVLLGNNAGGFQPAALTTQLSPDQESMTLGDVDGDGFPDLVTADSALIEIRLGDGSGLFGAPSQSLPESQTAHVGLADLNGDGRADLLTGSGSSTRVRLGDGAGGFAEPLTFTVTSGFGSSVVTDMNLDGAPDLVASSSIDGEFGFTFLTVLYNQSPAWAWDVLGDGLAGTHGLPTLAGSGALAAGNVVSLTLDQALENTAAALVVGLSVVNLPFKGGTFVPNADIVFLGLPTGSLGQITMTSTWPALTPPGSQVFFQYWIVDPAGVQGYSASNAAVCTSP